MDLEVFDLKLGKDAVVPRMTDDARGIVAVKLLDCVQTIADVLTVNDGGKGWTVTFDPGLNAYTDRSTKRSIVVSGQPLFDATPGTPLATVAKVMAGFVVHEVGHTDLDFFTAVRDRWPGKQLPLTLANIIEDVVLEAKACARYNGFADHGEGNIFRPTLEWVAERTSPKTPLKWSGSTGHKVNVTGQIVRYRDFVSFDTDVVTTTAVQWVEQWMTGIVPDLTAEGCVTLIEQWLDYVKATKAMDEPTPEPPKPPVTDGGTGSGQTLPNEDDDTEGGDGGSDGDGEAEDGEGNPGGGTEGDDSDDGDETEGPGGTDGDDGDDEGPTEGGDDGEGKGEGQDGTERSGDGNDADTMNRVDAPKGANDGPGKGGSGQAVADAADENDVLDDFEPDDLPQSFDDTAKPERNPEQNRLSNAEQEERVTTRVDAGAFGKMRVIFR